MICRDILRRCRRLAGLTQSEMAKRVGITTTAYSHRECDTQMSSRVSTLATSLNAMNIKARLVVELEDGTKESFRIKEK